MVQDNRFLRRLDPHGYPDSRPDVTMMAPFYFSLWSPTERAVLNSAEVIERALWNVEIGGYIRYLPYSPAERMALPGPYPHFTAWMAQYHYAIGNQDRAEAIMRWLFDNSSDHLLPENVVPVASVRRFASELRDGIDETARTSRMSLSAAEEIRTRRHAELDGVISASRSNETLRPNTPYVWAHVETLRALRRGGYVGRWEVEPSAHRSH
jgi:GH15 family glucan-1,4-alpha-glucosidase